MRTGSVLINLQHRHSFGIRSFARKYRNIVSDTQLPGCFQLDEPKWLLGEGTNTVFLEDYSGVIVHMQTRGVSIKAQGDHYLVEVQAGENWHNLVVYLLEQGVYGLENLALIPGSVGAAPIQNIGAYGAEFGCFCQDVKCFDSKLGQWLTFHNRDCQFGYRDSIFKRPEFQHLVITAITLKFPQQWQANINYNGLEDLPSHTSPEAIFTRVVSIRKNKLPDPTILGNAGSFFKNPVITTSLLQQIQSDFPQIPFFPINDKLVKVPAAYLIEQCGLKGHEWGPIATHTKQPLVLINLGEALGSDVLHAARCIKEAVQQRFAVILNNEVRLIGAEGEMSL